MTLRRTRDLDEYLITATGVEVTADNGPEDITVATVGDRIVVTVGARSEAEGYDFRDVDLDPDLARTLGASLIQAARVAERKAAR